MNPTTHPHRYRQLAVGEIRERGDLYNDPAWLPTIQPGDPVLESPCKTDRYYRLIPHMNKNNLQIDTHSVPALAKAVLSVLEPVVGKTTNYRLISGRSNYRYLFLRDDDIFQSSEPGSAYYRDKLDAATQFGELIDLFSGPKPIEIKLRDYVAVVTPGEGVQVGCQWASKDTVEQVLKAFEALKAAEVNVILTGLVNPQLYKVVAALFPELGIEARKYESEVRITGGQFQSHASEGFYRGREGSHWTDGHTFFDLRTQLGALIDHITPKKTGIHQVSLRQESGKFRDVGYVIEGDKLELPGMTTITEAEVEQIVAALQTK